MTETEAALAAAEAAEQAANEDWKDAIRAALADFAQSGRVFTSEHVAAWVARLGFATRENRALGGLMVKARNEGLIVDTGEFTRSAKRGNHAYPKRMYIGADFASTHRTQDQIIDGLREEVDLWRSRAIRLGWERT